MLLVHSDSQGAIARLQHLGKPQAKKQRLSLHHCSLGPATIVIHRPCNVRGRASLSNSLYIGRVSVARCSPTIILLTILLKNIHRIFTYSS